MSDTPNIAAICQRLAKRAPSKLSAEQIADRLGRPYNTLMSELSPVREGHKFDVNLLVPFMCMASVKSFGDMMVGTAKALEDGVITGDERRELARLGYRAVGDIVALLLQIDEAEARDRGRA